MGYLPRPKEDAARYLKVAEATGIGQQWMEIMTVHGSYASCPPEKRFLEAGTTLSQLVRAK
jgi:hypothetical protein